MSKESGCNLSLDYRKLIPTNIVGNFIEDIEEITEKTPIYFSKEIYNDFRTGVDLAIADNNLLGSYCVNHNKYLILSFSLFEEGYICVGDFNFSFYENHKVTYWYLFGIQCLAALGGLDMLFYEKYKENENFNIASYSMEERIFLLKYFPKWAFLPFEEAKLYRDFDNFHLNLDDIDKKTLANMS
ncbi:MAG: hypothetical protein EAZ85_00460 [Bacteroidetes bacterium]|nr:MAG: hypothetical protein EAZ85_00460 [Bacteroidota bacterium]TAG85661.1 MAG: hypothetical protein EAZ20_14520 [Bacteroidota bacterium]